VAPAFLTLYSIHRQAFRQARHPVQRSSMLYVHERLAHSSRTAMIAHVSQIFIVK